MMNRIPYGSSKYMTEEERRQHKRDLRNDWRHRHPEWVKEQNKKYADIRRETRPYICICKRCGCEFNATRAYMKICGKCPTKTELKRKAVQERKEKRQAIADKAVMMYMTGEYTQKQVAEHFGTYQRQVSVWVNKARKQLTQNS